MELIPESANLKDYLNELDVVDYSHPLIRQKADELFYDEHSEIEKVKIAFEFVRDKISHSWDIQSTRVVCKASGFFRKNFFHTLVVITIPGRPSPDILPSLRSILSLHQRSVHSIHLRRTYALSLSFICF